MSVRASFSPGLRGNYWPGRCIRGAEIQLFWRWSHRFGWLCLAYTLTPLQQFFDGDGSVRECSTLCGLVSERHRWSSVTSGHMYIRTEWPDYKSVIDIPEPKLWG